MRWRPRRSAMLLLIAAMALSLAACGAPTPTALGHKTPSARKTVTPPVQTEPPAPATSKVPAWPSGSPLTAILQPPGPTLTQRLSAVDFVSGKVGFVLRADCSGSRACTGTVLQTTDAGADWRPQGQVPVAGGIAFLSAQQGFAWGAGGLYATRNGGAQWARIYKGAVNWASFLTPNVGWIGMAGGNCATQGCPFAVEGTADGGKTWSTVAADALPGSSGGPSGRTLAWAEYRGMGLVPGGAGYVWTNIPAAWFLRTTDGGKHWSNTLPMQSSPQFSVSVNSSGNGWAIAYPYTGTNPSGTIYQTSDGGATWRAEGTEQTPWTVARTALDGSLWLLGGQVSGGYLHAAAFRGAGAPAVLPGGRAIQELDPIDASVAVALADGPEGTSLWRSTDGGQTWSPILASQTPVVADPVAFWNAQDGYGVDAQGGPGLLTTQDGGKTWSFASSLAEMPNAQADSFSSARTGWAVDQGGEVWQTRDGGATWQHVSSPPAWTGSPTPLVRSLSFIDQSNGFAIVGLNTGDLYKTSDGGETWTDVRPDVETAAFATPSAGWAMSHHVLYRTADGGRHWTPITQVPQNFSWVGAPPGSPDAVWLWDGVDGELAVSTDAGRTFLTSQLPVAQRGEAQGVPAISSPTAALLVIGSGLWQTSDAGAHWSRIDVLPPSP